MQSNRKSGRRERREAGAEFKAGAVQVAAGRRTLGVMLAQVERELDVRPGDSCAASSRCRSRALCVAHTPARNVYFSPFVAYSGKWILRQSGHTPWLNRESVCRAT
jgi:hypothetical protein